MQSPDQIHLVDSELIGIGWKGADLVLDLHALSYTDLRTDTYATQLIISNASIADLLPELPKEIIEVDLNFPSHSSHFHYLTLPFAMVHPCKLVFTLSSGSTFEAAGDSFAVVVGELISSLPIVFDL